MACFQGLAVGDAVGKQTETLSRADVLRWYPDGIAGFEGTPGTVIPRYADTRYEWKIAEITDDTEQTIAVAKALLRPEAGHAVIGTELMRCTRSVHPGVRVWDFQQSGDPARIAHEGDGCGAAMRVSPVGIVNSPDAWTAIANAAFQSSIPTHGGQFAICAAAAVAGAVAAAVEGYDVPRVLHTAVQAARCAEAFRRPARNARVGDLIPALCDQLSGRKSLSADDIAENWFPNRPACIVPLAVALALVTQSAERTALLAANVGGDADSVASIGSAIAGALRPDSVREDWFLAVHSINRRECEALMPLAIALANQRLRTQSDA